MKPPNLHSGFVRMIPWGWCMRAAVLPGKALCVALCLWKSIGITGSTTVAINLSRCGVDRCAASRGLRALERAELVRVERRPGRKPRVTVQEAT